MATAKQHIRRAGRFRDLARANAGFQRQSRRARALLSGAMFLVASLMPALAQQNSSPAPGLPSGRTLPKVVIPPQLPVPAVPSTASEGWLPAVQPQFNTTIIPKKAVTPKAAARSLKSLPPLISSLELVAFLTDAGQAIEKGIAWRIYKLGDLASDRPTLVRTVKHAKAVLQLPPGSYAINVAYGRAHLTRKINVQPVTEIVERFVLNAGGLRVSALLPGGVKASENAVTYDIFSDERNQFGNRTRIVTKAKPGVIFRLNAGIYFIVSSYGDANAQVRSDVTVEAGKLTEVTLAHSAARITFKLVARVGGEALADTQWRLTTQDGVIVKQSEGAIPSHILAAGKYVITAQHSNRLYRSPFQVVAGQDAQIEVIMQ